MTNDNPQAADPVGEACALLDRSETALSAADPRQAEALAREAVAIMARELGEEHPDHAASLIQRGRALAQLGENRAAEDCFRRAFAILEALPTGIPAIDQLAVGALVELSHVLRGEGRYGETRPLLEKALAMAKERLGPESEPTAWTLNAFGMLCKYDGSFAEGERHYRRALSILDKLYGEQHLDRATILHNLGGIAHARGDFAAGEPPARQAYEMVLAATGPDDLRVAIEGAAWAALVEGVGRLEEAREIYLRALATFERVYGEEHYEVAVTLNNLAGVADELGQPEEAERLYRRTLQMKEKLLGDPHPDTALTRHNLASFLARHGRPAEALPLSRAAAATFARLLPPDHPKVKASGSLLAELEENPGKVPSS
jgi:tetratricopeptide (TPR) repeat protein